jgi:hypothetical protein
MWSVRKRWVVAGAAAVLVIGGGVALWQVGQLGPLTPDWWQQRAMMPAIDAYLESPAYRQNNLGANPPAAYQSGQLKWECDAAIIEVRPDGGDWRVGMDVACGDYSRHGDEIDQLDSGDMGDIVLILSGGSPYRVLSAALEPTDGYNPGWVRQQFSFIAAVAINNNDGPSAPIPNNLALSAFGCAPGATGVTQTVGSNYYEVFPCRPA